MVSPSQDVISVYERHSLQWDRDRVRALFEASWLERFAVLLPDAAGLLDLGCGTAKPIAKYFIERGVSITGIDAAASQIAQCRRRFPAQEWIVADMRDIDLGRKFDGILAWDSFFHLSPPDQRSMFPIFQRHAAPLAPLMFTSGPKYGEAMGSYRGDPLYHASLDASEYRSLLEANGFEVVQHIAEDPDCDRHTVWLARRQPH